MTAPNSDQTDMFDRMVNHLVPIGLPYHIDSIIVGYENPINDPHLWALLSERPEGKYVERLILDSLESNQGKASQKMDVIFDKDADREFLINTAASTMVWLNRLERQLVRFRISDHYHLLRNRLYHDYASVETSIEFYPDKLVIVLRAYQPDDEEYYAENGGVRT